jgi:hypothetical protein
MVSIPIQSVPFVLASILGEPGRIKIATVTITPVTRVAKRERIAHMSIARDM